MTRISGYNIVGCPHCEAPYMTPSYSSVNFMALESWTDGYRTHSLMPPSESMRLCTACNEMYAISEVKPLGYLSRDEIDEVVLNPVPLAKTWLARLGRRLFGGPKPTTTTVRKANLPGPICWLPDEQVANRLSRLLAKGPEQVPHGLRFETELRIRLWQQGNHWYREGLLKARREQAKLPPPFTITPSQIENLVRLVALLQDERVGMKDRLLLVDALRQLGEFDLAREALSSENTERGWGWYQKMLIDQRMGHVGLYPD